MRIMILSREHVELLKLSRCNCNVLSSLSLMIYQHYESHMARVDVVDAHTGIEVCLCKLFEQAHKC
jgi:hypothetical protein